VAGVGRPLGARRRAARLGSIRPGGVNPVLLVGAVGPPFRDLGPLAVGRAPIFASPRSGGLRVAVECPEIAEAIGCVGYSLQIACQSVDCNLHLCYWNVHYSLHI
jgi:hypothetical protein